MEEAAELGSYLPRSFKTRGEQGYITFLWDAFKTDYAYDKHHFAFLSYYLLAISFVYITISDYNLRTNPRRQEYSSRRYKNPYFL